MTTPNHITTMPEYKEGVKAFWDSKNASNPYANTSYNSWLAWRKGMFDATYNWIMGIDNPLTRRPR